MIEIRGDKKVLITPISEEDLADIKIGDIVSVSYTHLDVYKRQAIRRGSIVNFFFSDLIFKNRIMK